MPPFPICRMPVTSVARFTKVLVTTPATALRMPLPLPKVNPVETVKLEVEAEPVTAMLVEVALLSVLFPLKVLVPEKVLFVVVEKFVEKTPVPLLYESGYVALKLVEETLLLKVVQSAEAR